MEKERKSGSLISPTNTDSLYLQVAEEFNIAIVLTNQVLSDPSGGALFVSDPKKPAGGHVMAHNSTVRLSVRKGKAEQRLIKVRKSTTPFLLAAMLYLFGFPFRKQKALLMMIDSCF